MKEQTKKYNWSGIAFPTPCCEKQFRKFEENNDVSIIVFGHEDDNIIPLYVPRDRRETVVRLFFQRSKNGQKSHYSIVRNMSRLVSSQVSKKEHKKFVCDYCLNSFGTEDLLSKHEEYCSKYDAVNTILPEPGKNILKFKNIQNQVMCPIKIVADFESLLETTDVTHGKTKLYQKHTPSAFCFYVVSRVKGFEMDPVTYVKQGEEGVSEIFTRKLEETTKKIYKRFKKSVPMIFDDTARKLHDAQNECYACAKAFENDKVRDHCHFTGKYRGALHSKCNLRLRRSRNIPVFFHNLTGYDSHLFVKRLADTDGSVDCIPHNEEKYITFSQNVLVDTIEKDGKEVNIFTKLKFIDTMNFMVTSLEKLVNNMEKPMFRHTSKYFSEEKLDLMLQKGVYPYEYVTDVDKLSETKLPSKECFSSSLSSTVLSDEDYAHAKKVFETLRCNNLGDYTELYCKSDVLLLADVFENFIDVCFEKFKLDPAHYITAPSLAMDAMLKMTEVELELLTDVDMYLFFEKGIRGGVSTITKRYGCANNKYMGDQYDPNKPSKFITYLDANNLYGWAMSQPLPVGDFKWLSDKEIEEMMNDHAKIKGCTLEVDLEYPEHLHDLHSDYPLAPESVTVNRVDKLIPNLNNKTKYVASHRLLQERLKQGLVITKIHRGIKYEESTFLKKYVDSNTASRTVAKNAFEKDFFKFMSNSVFGKTMEDVRNRSTVRIVNGRETKELERLTSKPNYKSSFIFENSELVSLRLGKSRVCLNKPKYLGQTILDVSKVLMYEFHYDYVKSKYGEKAELLFSDTDSLCYEIQTEDFFCDVSPDVERLFDTSGYPRNHPSKIPTSKNKKVIGLFKDEADGKIISEFFGLRSKLYAIKMFEGSVSKKCKGVKKAVVKNVLTFDDYKDCLFNEKNYTTKFNTLRSRRHEITTECVTKVALTATDDKRYVLPNDPKHRTLALGHHVLKNK